MNPRRTSLNRIALLIFAPVLVLTGVLGFAIPARYALLSGAPAYNVFHIVFGTLGLVLALLARESCIRAFNVGFGLIDLYQALASATHLSPESLFRWTRADDVLHVIIGAGLIAIGFAGRQASRRS